ncbi:hypothetical protein EA187_06070 [Lujinxingia sediminis]|uniref:Tryptophan synthase alpha chain n=1 Tax=Lujinxingia sediminis TaxID=2480984 RepID=A0ABY0CUH7_9DELT|nr:hypothetical protein [Lujinxingia sediminis]RVU46701.1 hypothetical protein EA187_06070 [Lujinxingia sediminis]
MACEQRKNKKRSIRDRLIVTGAMAVMLLTGCLEDPDAVVFGPGNLDVGADVAVDSGLEEVGEGDGGEADGGDTDVEPDADDPDSCVPGDEGCVLEHCDNGQHDGDESDVDCGGSCQGCEAGELCARVDDCLGGEVVEFLRCERADVDVCAPRGVGIYQVGELTCARDDGGQGRCVARFSENEVRREDDAACESDTEGVSCGQERVELGTCLLQAGQVCGTQGIRSVTTYQPQCSEGACQEVASTSQEECVVDSAPRPGEVCERAQWSAWGPCEPVSGHDSCAMEGTQVRTRTVARCTSGGACEPVSSEREQERRTCQRTPDPQSCTSAGTDDATYTCYQGQCCSPNCSDAQRSCRADVADGCGGVCPRLVCEGLRPACAMDGQCRPLCVTGTADRTCNINEDCGSMCACPLGAPPQCTQWGCACVGADP